MRSVYGVEIPRRGEALRGALFPPQVEAGRVTVTAGEETGQFGGGSYVILTREEALEYAERLRTAAEAT